MFHPRCGRCVVLLNGNKTAVRANPAQEFNRGIVFSLEPLKDNEVFEVKIDKKLSTWSGSIEIGVTVCNPDVIDVPITATDLRGGTWIMLGQGVLRDGRSLHEAYGCDLDKLVEGDRIGVMRTSQGDLKFFVNGDCQGVAAANLPPLLYAVVDMYGKCAQVTLTSPSTPDPSDGSVSEASSVRDSNLDIEGDTADDADVSVTSALRNHVANISIANSLLSSTDSNIHQDDRDEREHSDSSDDSSSALESSDENPVNHDEGQENVDVSGVHVTASHPVSSEGVGTNRNNSANDGRQPDCNEHEDHRANGHHTDNMTTYLSSSDRLRFHEKCGTLVKLSNGGRTAERRRPLDEFNNGVVMSCRALMDDELFEIRIDRLVDKWSGSIEVGITSHDPSHLTFPATMTNMRSGTTMMSGTGILTNGKGTHREYGEFNLDELKEGDRIGMMVKSNCELHYFINGLEQGVAASNVMNSAWAVVDLYGMTVKVTIVGRDEHDEQNLITRRNTHSTEHTLLQSVECINIEPLLFHTNCGTYAEVINGGKTAHRPNASDDFNNGVVLTSRPLAPNELFEVRLDKCVHKWAGSLEIGVTSHPPTDLEYPSTMTNIRSGTWMMTGNGVMHNGTTIVDDYGMNLDRLKVGNRVGVLRKENGHLHFFVNGMDQGLAATNIPEPVYGVVDLYGQAAQASIVELTNQAASEVPNACASNASIYSDIRFHHLHGKNAKIINGGMTAQRPNAQGEFNDAIVISNRQLHDLEMFEVVIDKMVDRWSGSLEAGVTAIPPEEIEFPSTMTDIDYDTWMLSGSSVMRDGITIRNNYSCDLDTLPVGTRIGMMRHSDGTLHYYVNGEDQGVACQELPSGLWPVVDLYGQCAQVTIIHSPIRHEQSLVSVSQYLDASHLSLVVGTGTCEQTLHTFAKCCGSNISFLHNNTVAVRVRHYNNGLMFSSTSMQPEELFEVRIQRTSVNYTGSIAIGFAALSSADMYQGSNLPPSLYDMEAVDTWWVCGSQVRKNSAVVRVNFCPNLSRLTVGDCVGVKKTIDGTMRFFINGEDFGVAATNVNKEVYAVVDLFGFVESVSIVSTCRQAATPMTEATAVAATLGAGVTLFSEDELRRPCQFEVRLGRNDPKPLDLHGDELGNETRRRNELWKFHENHGKNIQLSSDRLLARRSESYNQGLIFSDLPLPRNSLFQIRIGSLNLRWSSSLMLGITALSPHQMHLPNTAFALKKNTWIICGDSVFYNGIKIKCRYGPNLDSLAGSPGGHLIGIRIDNESRLHLHVNGVDQGVAAKEIPSEPYVVIDLYGQCHEVTILNSDDAALNVSEEVNKNATNKCLQQLQCSSQSANDRWNESAHSHDDAIPQKEKGVFRGLPDSTTMKNCEYQNMCLRFKNTLALPDEYFNIEGNLCYCETCHKIRGDEPFYTKGNPPTKYMHPFGWCYFALASVPAESKESWHMAYHGTKPGAIRRILDRGELLFSGELGVSSSLAGRKSKDDDSDGSQLCFSPNVSYAAIDAQLVVFVDPLTRKQWLARVVTQVAVEPGSYKVGQPVLLSLESTDSLTHFEATEWVTKERGATQLMALLVRIEENK